MWRRLALAAPALALGSTACAGDEFKTGGTGGAPVSSTGGSATGGAGGKAGGGNEGGTGECKGGLGCAPELPEGWSGLAALYEGPDGELDCGEGSDAAIRGGVGELSAPHTCSTCQCSLPAGVICTPPTVSIYNGVTCTEPPVATLVVDANCPQTLGVVSVKTTVLSAPAGGSCEPSGGVLTAPEPTFEAFAVVCDAPREAAGEACGEGGACRVIPAPPFEPAFCVYKTGNIPCPPSFPERRVVYGEVEDGRECTECDCGNPVGATCPDPLKGHTNASCGGGVLGSVPNDTLCHDITAFASINRDPPATGGSCAPVGGQAAGSAEPASPTTVCCAL